MKVNVLNNAVNWSILSIKLHMDDQSCPGDLCRALVPSYILEYIQNNFVHISLKNFLGISSVGYT